MSENKAIPVTGGKIAKPEAAMAGIEAYLTQATPTLRAALRELESMVVEKESTETEEVNAKEAAEHLKKARGKRDEAAAAPGPVRVTPRRTGGQEEAATSATTTASEEAAVKDAVADYNNAAKALDSAERRTTLRYAAAQAEREKGLAELQARITPAVLKVLLPGRTGLAFAATEDGTHVTPGAAIAALRAYIHEKPVVSMREQTTTTLKIVEALDTSLRLGKVAQGWREMTASLAEAAHTRGTATAAFSPQAVGRFIVEALKTALTPRVGGISNVVTLLEARIGSGRDGQTGPTDWKELLELLNDRSIMHEITEVVETVLRTTTMDGHARAAAAAGAAATNTMECHQWARDGKCSYGDKCKFSHQEDGK